MFKNINDIVSHPTAFQTVTMEYAHCDLDGNILKLYTTLQSAQYMVELLGGFTVEVFRTKHKILALGSRYE